ncbi:hypothetical protein [Actinophytocola sediminis]
MSAIPFALVSIDDHSKIFAFGLDIDLPAGREVITFRRESDGRAMFGVHPSVETARRRFSTVTPLKLVWEPGCRCCVCLTGEDCDEDGACSNQVTR